MDDNIPSINFMKTRVGVIELQLNCLDRQKKEINEHIEKLEKEMAAWNNLLEVIQ